MAHSALAADSDAAGPKSHFDPGAGATAVWIFQGDFYVSSRPDLFLTTVLGSCVAVCIRDPVAGCGGMNHFLLPDTESKEDQYPSQALRYGSYSIERLINAILSRGGRRERLEVKVFGGANVTGNTSDMGARNVDFIEHYFANERLSIAAADLRGLWPRKLRYFPTIGCAQVRELRDAEAAEAVKSEAEQRSGSVFVKQSGDVEIFKP
ncbi:MAG: chemoreceptor glutamine deamidase CheD [Aestuariivirga sp.]